MMDKRRVLHSNGYCGLFVGCCWAGASCYVRLHAALYSEIELPAADIVLVAVLAQHCACACHVSVKSALIWHDMEH